MTTSWSDPKGREGHDGSFHVKSSNIYNPLESTNTGLVLLGPFKVKELEGINLGVIVILSWGRYIGIWRVTEYTLEGITNLLYVFPWCHT